MYKQEKDFSLNHTEAEILHLLPHGAIAINRSLTEILILSQSEKKQHVFIYGVGGKPAEILDVNKEAISPLGENFDGILSGSWLSNKAKGKMAAALGLFLTTFSFSDILRIAKSPKCWLMHGLHLCLADLILLKIFRKKIVLINWGGNPFSTKTQKIESKFLWLYHKIFVLMSPEERYFNTKLFCSKRVQTLSYPAKSKFCDIINEEYSDTAENVILIGNNTWNLPDYSWFLNKLSPGGFSKIICMLNYGVCSQPVKDEFIKKYKDKFGETVFYPWLDLLPFDEYKKVLMESPYYISPRASQTGLGAIYTSVFQKKTLFLRGDNYNWLKSLGIKVVNLDEIKSFDLETIKANRLTEHDIGQNIEKLKEFFTNTISINNWYIYIYASFDSSEEKNFTCNAR